MFVKKSNPSRLLWLRKEWHFGTTPLWKTSQEMELTPKRWDLAIDSSLMWPRVDYYVATVCWFDPILKMFGWFLVQKCRGPAKTKPHGRHCLGHVGFLAASPNSLQREGFSNSQLAETHRMNLQTPSRPAYGFTLKAGRAYGEPARHPALCLWWHL